MQDITRRELMRLAAVSGLGALMGRSVAAKAPSALGVQLYTVRDQMTKDPKATLEAIASIGYREVEALRASFSKVAPMARSLGLAPVSVHVEPPFFTGKWDAWPWVKGTLPAGYDLSAFIAEAKAQGTKYLVLPYLMAGERAGTVAFYTDLAAALNRAGEQVAKAGLVLCYHNHGFEFEPLPDGRTPLDLLMSATDPALVKLELDVFWVSVSGVDPVALLGRYAGRVPLLHLKDKRKDAPVETQESKVPETTFVPVGTGGVDFPAVLAAAASAGVAHYFVEQDHAVGSSPVDALKASYTYLRSL